MITRRLLRIKILQVIFAYRFSEGKDLAAAEKDLFYSINRFYDLYHKMIAFCVELRNFAEEKIETAKTKKIPTYEDLNPNTKFIDNQFVKILEENEALSRYIQNNKLGWKNQRELVKDFYQKMIESSVYKDYIESNGQSFEDDKLFVTRIYSDLLPDFEPLYQQLEELSIYWNDEVELVISLIIKSFKKINNKDDIPELIQPVFRKDEDKEYAKKLLRKTLLNFDQYDELIKENSKNWDFERIAFMDMVIMKMAINELLEFPSIPTRVTLDEYIEIAKYYSTEKSNVFINGILDKIVSHLKEENKINKQGRGLIGEQ